MIMVKNALKNLSNGFLKTQKSILSAAMILGVASGANAVLGLVKSRLLAHFFGVSADLSIFYTADKIPNLIYSMLVVGALSTVFIPVFAAKISRDEKRAWDTASSVILMSVLFFVLVGGLIFVFAPFVIRLLSVGKFSADEVILGVCLMRIMLAAQLILIISSFITSILHSFKYFLVPAISPIAYNVGLIFGIVFLSDKFGIYGPAYGVILGSLAHLVIQLPLLSKIDFHFSFKVNFRDKGVQKIVALVPFRVLSVLMTNIVSTVNNSLAILVSTPSVVFYKFASQLQFFPVNLFGVSIASAMLPTLSFENEDTRAFKRILITSIHQTLFFAIPASIVLLVLRVPVIRLVYGASRFPWEATVKTSYALAFFSISIFSQSLTYLLSRAFYALKDTVTPVKVSALTVVLNILLSLFFVSVLKFGIWSIALSYSITSFLDIVLLLVFLARKLGGFDYSKLLIPFTKISYAAVFMGLSLYIPLKCLDQYVFDTTHVSDLILLTMVVSLAGTCTYLFFTWLFKVEEITLLYKLVDKLHFSKSKMSIARSEKSSILDS